MFPSLFSGGKSPSPSMAPQAGLGELEQPGKVMVGAAPLPREVWVHGWACPALVCQGMPIAESHSWERGGSTSVKDM